MMLLLLRAFVLGILLLTSALPLAASAHEVYVLTPSEVAHAIAMPSFDELHVAFSNLTQLAFWGFIAIFTVALVFFISVSRILERTFDPYFRRIRKYAPFIGRVTIGLSFIAAAYFNAIFGPELPLPQLFGPFALLVAFLLAVIGFAILFNFYTRYAAAVALILFLILVWMKGIYMLTYTNYFGEIIILLLIGAHHGLGFEKLPHFLAKISKKLAPYSFLILRVCFGVSLLFASLYAKVIHNNLALQVANHYPALVHFFGFEPHFLVLAVAIIEIVIGGFFVLGIEIRFTALFLEFWLLLSLWYFGEAVWPHLVLIGIPIAFICYGYDQYSFEGRFFKAGRREPVF